MGTTPVYALPYQELTDAPHGPNLGEDLAGAVETVLVGLDGRLDTLEAATHLVKLGGSTLGSPAATVTFSSIPATYSSLRLEILGRGDTAAQFVSVLMRFNNDSTTVYDYLQIFGSGASANAGAGETLGGTGIFLGDMPGSTCVAGSCAVFTASVPFYADATFWQGTISEKTLMSQTSGGQANQLWRKSWAGRWRNTAAINRIDIVTGSGNFIAGSSFALYGLP